MDEHLTAVITGRGTYTIPVDARYIAIDLIGGGGGSDCAIVGTGNVVSISVGNADGIKVANLQISIV